MERTLQKFMAYKHSRRGAEEELNEDYQDDCITLDDLDEELSKISNRKAI